MDETGMVIALTPLVAVRGKLYNVDKVLSTMPGTVEVLNKCKLLSFFFLYLLLTDMNEVIPPLNSYVEAPPPV